MSDPGLTKSTHELLGKFLELETEEQVFLLKAILEGMGSEFIDSLSLTNRLDGLNLDSEKTEYEKAKDILLDTPGLKSSEKVLLAAFCICDLYELREFTSRQVTESLHETGNQVSNITSILTGLYQKGFVEYEKKGGSQQSQKKYAFTAMGLSHTRKLLEPLEQTVAA